MQFPVRREFRAIGTIIIGAARDPRRRDIHHRSIGNEAAPL
jgi:hypothetical protein